MARHPPTHEPDQHARIDDDRVAEQRLARERRQHLGHDPHGRQDQDVHFGVAENPEEVLPQKGRRAGTGQEEMRAEETVEHQQQEHDGEDRERRNDNELRDERHPREHGQPHHRHPGRPQVQDGDDEVEPRRERRDPENLDAELVEIDIRPGGKLTLRQIRVGEPAGVRRDAQHAGVEQRPDEPACVQEQPAEEEHPVAEGIEPRKRHVPGADLERDDVVEKRRRQRHQREEQHRGAVHGEQLVKRLGTHEVAVRLGELRSDHQGLEPTDQEEGERGPEVEQPDPFVIDRGEPALETRGVAHFRLRR